MLVSALQNGVPTQHFGNESELQLWLDYQCSNNSTVKINEAALRNTERIRNIMVK